MTGRPRKLADFKGEGVSHFEAINFRFKCYVSRQYLWTIKYGNEWMYPIILQRSHWKFSLQGNVVADFIGLKLNDCI